tara:strand:- start:13115 stop:14455 length:1341 start_codon:yes stop_codon:yes gene_type:complete
MNKYNIKFFLKLINNQFIKYFDRIKAGSKSEIVSGSVWIFLGSSLSKLIFMISGIVAANILGIEKYGELGIARSSVNMFVVVATAGLGITSTKFIAQYLNIDNIKVQSSIKVINVFSISVTLFLSFILIVFSSFIAKEFLNAPFLEDIIKVGAVMLFFSSLNAVQLGTLYGFSDYKQIAINSLISAICEILFLSIGAYYYGVKGAILGSGFSFIIFYFLNYFSLKKHYRIHNFTFKRHLKLSDFDIIWQFAIPAALSSFLVVPSLWFIKSILVRKSGFSELSIFDIAEQWRMLILFIPYSVGRIVLPFLSKFEGVGNINKQVSTIKKMIILNVLITIALTLLIFCFSEYIMNFYGQDFVNELPLILMSISTIFSSVANVVGQVIASKSKMWIGFVFNLFWSIVLIVSSTYFLNLGYGATALASAILLSYFLHSIIQVFYVYQLLKK